MAKPRLIILIRHAQSEGNKNRDIHQNVPDHRVKLTAEGWNQAYDAGRRLRRLLRPEDKIHFFTSPYRRTRETTEGILATLTSDEHEPSPFRRSHVMVSEEPRLREQDFGNFQPCAAEMERMWQERADYGHFFYRIPNGESAADAYDRVSGFNESLWRQFGEDDFASVCVLVTHGLMSRVFLMRWYHFTVEYFEDLRNVDHCEFLIMRKLDNGKYDLETKLRTWSELKRERAAAIEGKEKEKEKAGKSKDTQEGKDEVKLQRNKTFVVTRRWGGCPDGCNHTSRYRKRQDLESLRQRDIEQAAASSHRSATQHRHRTRQPVSSDNDDDDDDDDDDDNEEHAHSHSHSHTHTHPHNHHGTSSTVGATEAALQRTKPAAENTPTEAGQALHPDAHATQQAVELPRGTHLGRDFGGSYSGHTSAADSDSDSDKPNDAAATDDDDDSEAASAAAATVSKPSSRDDGGGLHQRRRRDSILNSIEARLLQATIKSHHHHHGRQLSTGSADSANTAASSPGIGPFANRLGDVPLQPSHTSDDGLKQGGSAACRHGRRENGAAAAGGQHEDTGDDDDPGTMEELEAAEAADKSIQGSVY